MKKCLATVVEWYLKGICDGLKQCWKNKL